jgi:hypothetical protein
MMSQGMTKVEVFGDESMKEESTMYNTDPNKLKSSTVAMFIKREEEIRNTFKG